MISFNLGGHFEQGRTIAVKLDPGIPLEQLSKLGFRPVAVVNEIHRTELSDAARRSHAFRRPRANPMAIVTAVRDGMAHVLTLEALLPGEVVRGP